jgi:GT2 family glycosyltransferase
MRPTNVNATPAAARPQRQWLQRARRVAGVLARDAPIYLDAFWRGGESYLGIRNRAERLSAAPQGPGYSCGWQWTSELHAPKVIPALGRHLMRRALSRHPISLDAALTPQEERRAQVSFLIGHRGTARLPHLLATLNSIAAQRDAAVECIVVEQEEHSELAAHLPSWVRLVHTPPPARGMPYCRSWAFNVGARHATGDVLVLHDNDMLVPADYSAHVLSRVAQGYEVLNLKRFVFYLSQAHTDAIFERAGGLQDQAPETVVQNLEAGGSVVVARAAFDALGGMDESFVGWGGEDNEFWERAQTVRTWVWGMLPIVHLWHSPQAGKRDPAYDTAQRYRELSLVEPRERIDRLRMSGQGRMTGPRGWVQTDRGAA